MAGDVENSIIQSVRHVPKRRHVRLQLEQDCPAAPVVQAEGAPPEVEEAVLQVAAAAA
jgi:hypothetical protein